MVRRWAEPKLLECVRPAAGDRSHLAQGPHTTTPAATSLCPRHATTVRVPEHCPGHAETATRTSRRRRREARSPTHSRITYQAPSLSWTAHTQCEDYHAATQAGSSPGTPLAGGPPWRHPMVPMEIGQPGQAEPNPRASPAADSSRLPRRVRGCTQVLSCKQWSGERQSRLLRAMAKRRPSTTACSSHPARPHARHSRPRSGTTQWMAPAPGAPRTCAPPRPTEKRISHRHASCALARCGQEVGGAQTPRVCETSCQ